MALRFKDHVMPAGMHPMIVSAVAQAVQTFRQVGKDCIITSANDSPTHRRDSYHYCGMAVDLRSHHLDTPTKRKVLQTLRETLGEEFDVLLEGEGTANEHYHIEFDAPDAIRMAWLEEMQERFRERVGV